MAKIHTFLCCMVTISVLITSLLAAPEGCEDGPSYWCINDSTAKECGAINLCLFERSLLDKIKFVPQSSAGSTKSNEGDLSIKDAAPVNVTLYYESLCPDCKEIWQYQLFPTFQKLQSSRILNVQLVPYGNAQERAYGSGWVFYCQHGEAECKGNLIETCILKHYPDQSLYVPLIQCIEYYGPTTTNAQYCASLHSVDYNVINTCVTTSEGNSYQHEMALKTDALNPPHQYVPWFTMNGYHDNTIQQQLSTNMLAYVCSTYTGTKPLACSQRQRLGASYRDQ